MAWVTAREAARSLTQLRSTNPVLPDPEDLVQKWLALCETRQVLGKPAHDARIVAWMESHGITDLVTLNPGDFAKFPEVRCLEVG